MDNSNQTGFTLIELLVTIAVAGILLGIGVPSFSNAIKNSQVSSDYNELVQALYLARSEAVKTSRAVTLCPRKELNSQQCGSGDYDWKNGWLVFIDNRPASNGDAAAIGPEDEIISIHEEPRSKNIISAYGSNDRSTTGIQDRAYIQYGVEGQSDWGNGTFTLCNDKEDGLSRAINIAPTGDVRPGRPSGSERPRDVYNAEVC